MWGDLKVSIPNPYDCQSPLFIMFDTVHLFKCIRNNWFNEKMQCLLFPSFNNFQERKLAQLNTIKTLYMSESNSLVKLAPSLNQKVLFPSSFERQNVKLVTGLFNEKVVAALTLLHPSEDGLIEFLNIINKWWNIVNVKTFLKGQTRHLPEAEPIKAVDSNNLVFLEKFVDWLQC